MFQPGLNEDLTATAVWGTRQLDLWPGAKVDGAFGGMGCFCCGFESYVYQ